MAQEAETEVIPAVADALRGWFPELGDRSLPVTDAQITKDNLPQLPLAMVAPLRQTYVHNSGQRMTVNEDFMIEIWLKPVREQGCNGETPFWSYYDFNKFRNRVFTLFAGWRTPQNGAVRFLSFEADADEYAVMMSFRMRAIYDLCPDDLPQGECEPTVHVDGQPARFSYSLCQPKSLNCGDYTPPVEVDPCAK